MRIYIPTYARYDAIHTFDHLPDHVRKITSIVVYEGEPEKYPEKYHPYFLIAPLSVKGIHKTRQWIQDQHDISDPLYGVLDDDVVFYENNYYYAADDDKIRTPGKTPVDWELLLSTVDELFESGEYGMIGFPSTYDIVLDMQPMKKNGGHFPPYKENTRVLGACFYNKSLISEFRYDRIMMQEDLDFPLQVLENGIKICKCTGVYYGNTRKFGDPGGCSTYRTSDMVHEALFTLRDLHAPGIVKINKRVCVDPANGLKEICAIENGEYVKYYARVAWKKAYDNRTLNLSGGTLDKFF